MSQFRVVLLVAFPSLLAAQTEKPRPEIGVRGGWMQISEKSDFGDNKYSMLALPTGVFGSAGGMHATFFVAPRVALEPQLGLMRLSEDGDSFMLTALALQPMFFLGADATKAPYVFAQVATLRESEADESDSRNAFGGGVGYRKVHRESLAMRYELRFRRWSDEFSKINEIGVLIGVGAVIRR